MPGVSVDPAFDKADYKAHPEAYESIFHSLVVPAASIIINCMYWEPRFPRLLTCAQAKHLADQGRLRLIGVCDITCDFQGSIEFLKEFTTIDEPFYVYDPATEKIHKRNLEAPGGMITAPHPTGCVVVR
jgi:alpha-aminoadipic semialdehyde synthase